MRGTHLTSRDSALSLLCRGEDPAAWRLLGVLDAKSVDDRSTFHSAKSNRPTQVQHLKVDEFTDTVNKVKLNKKAPPGWSLVRSKPSKDSSSVSLSSEDKRRIMAGERLAPVARKDSKARKGKGQKKGSRSSDSQISDPASPLTAAGPGPASGPASGPGMKPVLGKEGPSLPSQQSSQQQQQPELTAPEPTPPAPPAAAAVPQSAVSVGPGSAATGASPGVMSPGSFQPHPSIFRPSNVQPAPKEVYSMVFSVVAIGTPSVFPPEGITVMGQDLVDFLGLSQASKAAALGQYWAALVEEQQCLRAIAKEPKLQQALTGTFTYHHPPSPHA